ncbi:MAG: hypothetical protein JSS81_29970 [Acidobacteria bacterium]|nr:hypothetical protein [Acidobacteriota bacterium]
MNDKTEILPARPIGDQTEVLPAREILQSNVGTAVLTAEDAVDPRAPTEVAPPIAGEETKASGGRRSKMPAVLLGLALAAGAAGGFAYFSGDLFPPAAPDETAVERRPHAGAAETSTARDENADNGRPFEPALRSDPPESRKTPVEEPPVPADSPKAAEPAPEKTTAPTRTTPPNNRKNGSVYDKNVVNDADSIVRTPPAAEKKQPVGQKTRQTYGGPAQPNNREARNRPNDRPPPFIQKVRQTMRGPRGGERPPRPNRKN